MTDKKKREVKMKMGRFNKNEKQISFIQKKQKQEIDKENGKR